jgi:hypothetical protein
MKATDVLVSQHAFLRGVFAVIERELYRAESLEEVKTIARLVEGFKRSHLEGEESFLFQPLDALLRERGQTSHLYEQHKEHAALLKQVQTAPNIAEARSNLLLALRILRAHFKEEERVVLPTALAAFQPESLETLGKTWLEHAVLHISHDLAAPTAHPQV